MKLQSDSNLSSSPAASWEIPPTEIEINLEEIIATGSTAEVYMARYKNKDVIVKWFLCNVHGVASKDQQLPQINLRLFDQNSRGKTVKRKHPDSADCKIR